MSVKDGAVVLTRLEDGVLTVTLNRPERHNAANDEVVALLHEAVRGARDDGDCRVIVLEGAGRSFCAGWDVDALAALGGASRDVVREGFERNRVLVEALAEAPQATVARVHGAVLGFGLGLVASCDIAVAGEGTTVALPEVALGVIPAIVMAELLGLPEKVALDWLLSGDRRTAADGLAAGLFSRVVPDDALDAEVSALAARLASYDPATVAGTKRLYRRLHGLPRDEATRQAIAAAVDAFAGAAPASS